MSTKTPPRLLKRLKQNRLSEDASRKKLLPSPNPATNLLIADIVVRGASTLFRKNVEKRVARASLDTNEEAEKLLNGKTMITTLGLYGASKIAARSPGGLALVAGGLALKTLYDRGKERQLRRSGKKLPGPKGKSPKGESAEGEKN